MGKSMVARERGKYVNMQTMIKDAEKGVENKNMDLSH